MHTARNIIVTGVLSLTHAAGGGSLFTDVTDEVGLGPDVVPQTVSRLAFADLTGNGYPDAIIDRHRIFRNEPSDDSPIGRRFVEIPSEETGLKEPVRSTVTVFADLNNNGHLDAIVAEHVEHENPMWEDHGRRTGWHEGRGDGTFGPRQDLPVPERPTVALAVGDVTGNGWLDLYFGNSYRIFGMGFEAYPNDLLLADGEGGWQRSPLPEDDHEFTEEEDLAGRPTYGAMILRNPIGDGVMLLELNYGRRWNRAWVQDENGAWVDIAPEVGLDGDEIRHGRYPEWLHRRAEEDARFQRQDEDPFRSNGNTFDATVADVNGNGRFDLFVSEIAHGWAGESSDRSRFLFNQPHDNDPGARFVTKDAFNVDRIPPAPDDPLEPHNWNQGDLFAELADIDHSGWPDLILSSGDYPDDQRLRIYRNIAGERVEDITRQMGIDHDGSQQISLADVDGSGALDILVGQTFTRYPAEMREGRSPKIRLFRNRAAEDRASVTLRLRGDGERVNTHGLGAIVRAEVGDRTITQQLVGPGGHAGKQHDFLIHFGLGEAERIDRLIIIWPDEANTEEVHENFRPGRYRAHYRGEVEHIAVGR